MAKNSKNIQVKSKETKQVKEATVESTKKVAKKNVPVEKAPEVKVTTTEQETKKETPVKVIDATKFAKEVQSASLNGMDPNRRADLLRIMHETWRMDPDAAAKYGVTQETVNEVNRITAIGQIAALASEIALAKNPFALKMNAATLADITRIGEVVGLSIDVKALPAPDANGMVEIPSTAMAVSSETKAVVEQEKAAAEKKVELDPTKVYNDEAKLKEALEHIFATKKESVFSTVHEAIKFLHATRMYAASKAENPEEATALVKNKPISEQFDDLTSIIKPNLLFTGIGRHMVSITGLTKNPISAFTIFRNASKNKKTGIPALDDSYIAALTKAVIKWICNENIKSHEKTIAELDAEKNKTEIDKSKDAITHYNEIIENTCNPSFDIVRNLINDMKSDDSEVKRTAIRIMSEIRKSYYTDVTYDTTYVNMNKNLQQYAGIILNWFKDPMERSSEYVESNITELVPVETKEPEQKTESEEKPKEDEKNA